VLAIREKFRESVRKKGRNASSFVVRKKNERGKKSFNQNFLSRMLKFVDARKGKFRICSMLMNRRRAKEEEEKFIWRLREAL
jgi:hypothetical protein